MYTIFKYERKGGPERFAVYYNSADHIVALDLTEEQLVEWHVAQAADDAERRIKRLLLRDLDTMRPTEVTKYAKKAAERGRPPWDPNAPKSLQMRAIEARTAKRKAQREVDAADIEIEAVKSAVREHHKKVEAQAIAAGRAVPKYDRLDVEICRGVATVTPQDTVSGRDPGRTYYIEIYDEHGDPLEHIYPLGDL